MKRNRTTTKTLSAVKSLVIIITTGLLLAPAMLQAAEPDARHKVNLGAISLVVETEFEQLDLMRPRYLDLHMGRLYVLDVDLHQVHFWNIATGKHEGFFGRKGSGPGEFMLDHRVGEIICFKDRILIVDEQASKVHYFNNDHQFLKSEPMASGRWFFRKMDNYILAQHVSTASRVEEIVMLDKNLNTVRVLASKEYLVHEWLDEGRFIHRPFADQFVLGSTGDRVYVGRYADNRIKVFDQNGNYLHAKAVPVVQKDLDKEVIEAFRKSYKGQNRVKLELEDKAPFFNRILPFGDVMIIGNVDRDGNWDGGVYSSDLKRLGKFETSFQQELTFFGSYGGSLMTVSYGDDDRHIIRKWGVVRNTKQE